MRWNVMLIVSALSFGLPACAGRSSILPTFSSAEVARFAGASGGELQLGNIVKTTTQPNRIVAARDGSIWYTTKNHPFVIRVSSDGSIKSWRAPDPDRGETQTLFIVEAKDGSIWFDYSTPGEDSCGNGVGHIVAEKLTVFKAQHCEEPWGIAIGKDGRAYVVDLNAFSVEAFNDKGLDAVYTIQNEGGWAAPDYIASGPDGNLWMSADHFIAKMDVHGNTQMFRLDRDKDPKPLVPWDIAGGPDGNVWFNEEQADGNEEAIASITPQGHITQHPLDYPHFPIQLVPGPNKSLWFLDASGQTNVGSVSMNGKIAYYTIESKIVSGYYAIGGLLNGRLEVGGRIFNQKGKRYYVGTLESGSN